MKILIVEDEKAINDLILMNLNLLHINIMAKADKLKLIKLRNN